MASAVWRSPGIRLRWIDAGTAVRIMTSSRQPTLFHAWLLIGRVNSRINISVRDSAFLCPEESRQEATQTETDRKFTRQRSLWMTRNSPTARIQELVAALKEAREGISSYQDDQGRHHDGYGSYDSRKQDKEGFMNIPDGVEDEGLPFN